MDNYPSADKNNMKNKGQMGQISILTTILIASSTIIASALGAWATASSRVNMIDTKVQVVEERENNRYLELKESLNRVEKKLDKLIELKE